MLYSIDYDTLSALYHRLYDIGNRVYDDARGETAATTALDKVTTALYAAMDKGRNVPAPAVTTGSAGLDAIVRTPENDTNDDGGYTRPAYALTHNRVTMATITGKINAIRVLRALGGVNGNTDLKACKEAIDALDEPVVQTIELGRDDLGLS